MENILIISLGRKGMEEHTKNMIQYLNASSFTLIHSKYSLTQYIVDSKKVQIKTYNSNLSFVLSTIFRLPYLLYLIYKIRNKHDILYIPVNHPWNLPIIILWRILKKITILTIHDAEMHPGEENIVVELSSKYAMKFTNYLVFLSNHVQTTAYNKYGLTQEYRIISQGLFPLPDIKLTQGRSGKRILFLGRISKYKGVDLLIEAVEGLSIESYDSLTIAGMPLYDYKKPKDTKKIKIIAKYLSEEDMSYHLNNCDIVVLPYIEASQSGIVLLATLAEKPMICSNLGGLKEQLTKDECIFINPVKEELQRAILELLNNDVTYDKIQENLRKKKPFLTWTYKANELMSFINYIRIQSPYNEHI